MGEKSIHCDIVRHIHTGPWAVIIGFMAMMIEPSPERNCGDFPIPVYM
jgi:hypothetical protein